MEPNLIKVEAVPPLQLRLEYETGEIKLFDVTPYANGSWFSELRDPLYFRTVRLLPDGSGIEWAHG